MPVRRRAGVMTQDKELFTPWEQVLPGTHSPRWLVSMPTCTSPSETQLLPVPQEALALDTAFLVTFGSTKLAGAWPMPRGGHGTSLGCAPAGISSLYKQVARCQVVTSSVS